MEQSPDGCYPSLPAELILAILDNLPLEDLLNARIVNKTWNMLAVDNAKLQLAEWMSKVKHAAPRYLELYYKRTGLVVHKTHDFVYLNEITKCEFTQLGGLSMDFETENYWSSPADATKFPRRCFPVVRKVQVYLMEFPQQFPGVRGCELCRNEAKELEEAQMRLCISLKSLLPVPKHVHTPADKRVVGKRKIEQPMKVERIWMEFPPREGKVQKCDVTRIMLEEFVVRVNFGLEISKSIYQECYFKGYETTVQITPVRKEEIETDSLDELE